MIPPKLNHTLIYLGYSYCKPRLIYRGVEIFEKSCNGGDGDFLVKMGGGGVGGSPYWRLSTGGG